MEHRNGAHIHLSTTYWAVVSQLFLLFSSHPTLSMLIVPPLHLTISERAILRIPKASHKVFGGGCYDWLQIEIKNFDLTSTKVQEKTHQRNWLRHVNAKLYWAWHNRRRGESGNVGNVENPPALLVVLVGEENYARERLVVLFFVFFAVFFGEKISRRGNEKRQHRWRFFINMPTLVSFLVSASHAPRLAGWHKGKEERKIDKFSFRSDNWAVRMNRERDWWTKSVYIPQISRTDTVHQPGRPWLMQLIRVSRLSSSDYQLRTSRLRINSALIMKTFSAFRVLLLHAQLIESDAPAIRHTSSNYLRKKFSSTWFISTWNFALMCSLILLLINCKRWRNFQLEFLFSCSAKKNCFTLSETRFSN